MTVKSVATGRVAHPAQSKENKRIISYRTQRLVVRTIGGLILAAVLIIALFPPYFMFVTAFHPPTLSTARTPTLFSTHLTWKAFQDLFNQYPYLTWVKNTVIVSVFSTVLSVSFAIFAGYSLSRLRYPGRKFFGNAVFFVYLFPSTLLFIPIYILCSDLHLVNSLPALIAIYLTFSIPFSVYMLKAYFLNIPRELEDAALVDGATRWQTMIRIVLPLATPGIATAAIYSFTLAWNEYLYAFTLLSDNNYTLSPGITKLIFGDVFLWGQIMAAGVMMSIPLLILYFVAQRYIVAGLAAGAVKG